MTFFFGGGGGGVEGGYRYYYIYSVLRVDDCPDMKEVNWIDLFLWRNEMLVFFSLTVLIMFYYINCKRSHITTCAQLCLQAFALL